MKRPKSKRTTEQRKKYNATAHQNFIELNVRLAEKSEKKCRECRRIKPFAEYNKPSCVLCIACTKNASKANKDTVNALKQENKDRIDGKKTCIQCRTLKPLDDFNKPGNVNCMECTENKIKTAQMKVDEFNTILVQTSEKQCIQCHETKPFCEYNNPSYMRCIACQDKQKKAQKERIRAIKKDNVTREDGLKTCIRCYILKQDTVDFGRLSETCTVCCKKREAYSNTVPAKFSACVRDAKKRHIPHHLDFIQCGVLFRGDCHQCGLTIADKNGKLNGIDRMNNNEAYIPSNVASYCGECNFRKQALDPVTVSLRAIHCRSIRLGFGPLHPNAWEDRLPSQYWRYKTSAMERNIEFKMTKEQYKLMISTPCCDCQRPITKTNKSGIDRIDPGKGYVQGNMIAMSTECNIMKGKMTIDQHINSIFRIAAHADITIANTPKYIPTCLRSLMPNTFRQQHKLKK